MTGGPHPSARVAGGPARQRHARGEEADWAAGERREREGGGPSRPKRGRGGKRLFRDVTNPPPLQESRPRDSRRLARR
uniref:Uncharacterized protein n=1 Tax=Oryza sativa subsp. japonica TaxID=39947 RepID=Q6ZF20_ORYSJ|nr:hypothetical protein [Oryza sativa Japonica Group]BAD31634.1 hypothetical protein [Oryza sativa Japonica Group]